MSKSALSQTGYPREIVFEGKQVVAFTPYQVQELAKLVITAELYEMEIALLTEKVDSLERLNIVNEEIIGLQEQIEGYRQAQIRLRQEIDRIREQYAQNLSAMLKNEKKRKRKAIFISLASGTGFGVITGLLLPVLLSR